MSHSQPDPPQEGHAALDGVWKHFGVDALARIDRTYHYDHPEPLERLKLSVSELEVVKEAIRHIRLSLGFTGQRIPSFPRQDRGEEDWDWATFVVNKAQYHKIFNAVTRSLRLRRDGPGLRYDFTPHPDGMLAELTIRRPCLLQGQFTRLVEIIISRCLGRLRRTNSQSTPLQCQLERDLPWPALTKEGTLASRYPCATFDDNPGSDFSRPARFVLEVGMGEKSKVIRRRAEEYVRLGSALVVIFDLSYRRPQTTDPGADPMPCYSVYRRKSSTGGPPYEASLDAEDVVFAEDLKGQYLSEIDSDLEVLCHHEYYDLFERRNGFILSDDLGFCSNQEGKGCMTLKMSDFFPLDRFKDEGQEDFEVEIPNAQFTKAMELAATRVGVYRYYHLSDEREEDNLSEDDGE
ncbi:hypothetical protein NKR23_g10916 [Pleurostoma richardsiae]|uniref:Uncharacterized protein n=1 Tax=Pleurostoma richardsiae TaxID=41990 RepID=A0AA38R233_9PEZI|nr:hypothetical protein NKR23_g10916 [Pleurostoma richardsiae]